MSIRNLEFLFRPASIAIVGASSREGSLGAVVWRNVAGAGFPGPVWAVNPRAQPIDGKPAYASVDTLPSAPDLAIVCSPAETVPGVIAQLVARGTRAAIVMTAGLRDTQDAAGVTLEQAMLDAARPGLLRILGPNCIGALVPGAHLNASFAPCQARDGSLAFVTQSGALATAMLDWADARGVGFSHFISVGDSADVDFGDLLDYLGSDAQTRAILLYVESVKHARKFMSAARAAARNKPVIVVKAGRAPDGARAAASHTGALAGSDAVFEAAARRAGMLRVGTLEDLFDAAETLAHPRPWRGHRLAVMTNGGGAGVLAADALAAEGGTLAQLSPATLEALDAVLPRGWSHGNPVDLVGDAPASRYAQAARILADAGEVDGIVFMHAPTAIVTAVDVARAALPALRNADKPVLAVWLGGASVAEAREACADIPCYPTPERAVAAWMQLARHRRAQEALLELADASLPDVQVDGAGARELVAQALHSGHAWMDEASAKALLAAYGIPVARSVLVRDVEEALAAAAEIGYPVAVKVAARRIVHKSDVGGVVLDIGSPDALRRALVDMRLRVAAKAPNAGFHGFVVQEMVRRPGAREVILGVASDAVFGPVVLFGGGGTSVEVRRDSAVELPPLNGSLARGLVSRTQAGRLLAGYRGKPAANEAEVLATLLKLSQLACDLPEVCELDINPLLVDAQGVIALDARVRLRPAEDAVPPALRPYPSELEESFDVGGSTLRIRPIRPDDGVRMKAFYAAARPEDLRMRFFHSRREVPASELARYCQIDYDREMAFVATDGAAIAGEVRAVCDPDNIRAEFAIQVAGPWQGKGLGGRLLGKMLAYLRSRGTGEVTGECLEANTCMVALARRSGFATRQVGDDTVALRLSLR